MSRTSASYGRRGRVDDANTGVRHPAPTYGKAKLGTYSQKANGNINVEQEAERFVSHLLAIDPRVRGFQPQPFCVDLIDKCLLLTKAARSAAWHAYRELPGPKLYTPDFSVVWQDGLHYAVEVKLEGFEGDEAYWEKIARARPILTANGYPLRTLVMPTNTAHPLRTNARLLKQAMHQRHTYLTAALVERVRERCEAGPVTVRTLCEDLQLLPDLMPVLLVSGLLTADVAHHPIRGTLEVSLAQGDLSHLCLLEEVER
ncbi:Tn7 transposase TnsA N-terminal domain-containing protein [Chromobacterium sp. IIBBL 290-4]|uniref:Tn7 transposase TnsA N-terminal domain-containing protein n=1 Tax=Chromobacterium sp. IIBBL 290-4 TaxID=2953890 RepID=UPI0020B86BC0|nr:Tn7 transposase TnsA N-terminal domain-containing protein [Chromobacterium sp. IIBBL 290-4]UTH75646.1 Tn7 transposase TnsA N-terminal domain-containing protein [Chromobacterium sp. IIBBL 290-4]